MGGLRIFHVEHFRPKSRFPELINDIRNLFYACPICNSYKGNDWPAEPDQDLVCYPDPSITEYGSLFDIDLYSGSISGNCVASRYLVERIALNRNQLVMERRLHSLIRKAKELRNLISRMLEHLTCEDRLNFYKQFNDLLNSMHNHRDKLYSLTPYDPEDVKRPYANR